MRNATAYPDTTVKRFWAKVQKTETCWLWTAHRNYRGYGYLYNSALRKQSSAHRYSYELANGPIPSGMNIDHLCYNRACVRPEHLRLATPLANAENRAGANSCSTTGVRCVRLSKYGTYQVHVGHMRKTYYGGTFPTLEEAEAAAINLRNSMQADNLLDRQAG